LGIGWYIQGCTTVVSKTVYHPCLFGGQAGASSLLFMYGQRSYVNLNPQTIICDFEISLIPLC
ncbi:hypothetical protein T05_11566, partial [Trichinella murrelli]